MINCRSIRRFGGQWSSLRAGRIFQFSFFFINIKFGVIKFLLLINKLTSNLNLLAGRIATSLRLISSLRRPLPLCNKIIQNFFTCIYIYTYTLLCGRVTVVGVCSLSEPTSDAQCSVASKSSLMSFGVKWRWKNGNTEYKGSKSLWPVSA